MEEIKGNTFLNNLVGTGSNIQVEGLDEDNSFANSESSTGSKRSKPGSDSMATSDAASPARDKPTIVRVLTIVGIPPALSRWDANNRWFYRAMALDLDSLGFPQIKGQNQKMMFQQIWHFLPITAFLFSLSDHTFAEVVQSISDCDHYFLNHTPPHVPGILEDGRILNQNRYKPICQTYRNRRRFVTLYDVQNKIPVFSAFRFVDQVYRKRPKTYWKIEPQLENETTNKNMMRENKMKNYTYQASNKDYKANNTFDRGHIFPSSYASSKEDKESTFTLTNIVPQAESFNKGSWNKMEMCTKCVMEKYCINSSGGTEGFVVTGAQPSLNSMLNNRVNVPSALWSAFCCYSAVRGAWIASGHWGDNVQDESKHKYLETMNLENLQHILGMSNSEFVMFPGTKCPLTTTVTEFYPKLKNCPCPPTIHPVSGSITSPPSHFAFIFPLFVYSYLHWVSC